MARSGFKMKGYDYPGTPLKNKKGIEVVEQYASGEREVKVDGDDRSSDELLALADKAKKAGNTSAADKLRKKANKKTIEKNRAQDYLNQA